ncbi:sigma-54-dependent transcriptional regulator, partial [Streptomyces sp. NPDC090442]|uniref:sigma-54-dependent transcriptional regulator n=1 Tax=Streptomyces sp. NPDC090442 TaxID=3365962 RepID=UPI00383A5C4A
PDGSGMDLVAEISQKYPNTPVAMITAFGNVEAAVEALKAGAFDFVAKPVDLSVLRDLVRHALELHETRRSASEAVGSRLYGESPAMIKLRQTIGKVARSQAPVYIAGESGVGKELVARTIHSEGGRADGPFVPVNCGAIPAELMESEFFGHKKGSFTGAHADKPGLFQAADGGTLFLDEIGDLPLDSQASLLRFLQQGTIERLGGHEQVSVDVRIVSATHHDLDQAVADGKFRADLYHRLCVLRLRQPPLRERGADIDLLAEHALHRYARETSRGIKGFSPCARLALHRHAWPGNVRELINRVRQAVVMAEGRYLTAADLHIDDTVIAAPTTLEEARDTATREAIERALQRNRGRLGESARELEVSRVT